MEISIFLTALSHANVAKHNYSISRADDVIERDDSCLRNTHTHARARNVGLFTNKCISKKCKRNSLGSRRLIFLDISTARLPILNVTYRNTFANYSVSSITMTSRVRFIQNIIIAESCAARRPPGLLFFRHAVCYKQFSANEFNRGRFSTSHRR